MNQINPSFFAKTKQTHAPSDNFQNNFEIQQQFQSQQQFQNQHQQNFFNFQNKNQFQNFLLYYSQNQNNDQNQIQPFNQLTVQNQNQKYITQQQALEDFQSLQHTIFQQTIPSLEIYPTATAETAANLHQEKNLNSNLNRRTKSSRASGAEAKGFKKLRRIKRKANFNKSFSFLREKLNLRNCSRKFQFDSLLKKVKSKIFKTIYDSLRTCLRENYRLQRLPQTFITDIKIDSNQCLLHKSVQEIYKDFGISLSIAQLLEEDFIKKEKLDLFSEFLSLSFVEVYRLYMESKQYLKDSSKIRRKEGEKFGELFKFIAKIFLDYYLLSKGNRPKTKPERNPKHLFRVIHKKRVRGTAKKQNESDEPKEEVKEEKVVVC